jgi:dipeptidyl aminopeptidase/acylaminoacyl peptidase
MEGADQQVDPSQPVQLAEQLQSLGKTLELVIFAKVNHFREHNRNDRDLRAVVWFQSYLVRWSQRAVSSYNSRAVKH